MEYLDHCDVDDAVRPDRSLALSVCPLRTVSASERIALLSNEPPWRIWRGVSITTIAVVHVLASTFLFSGVPNFAVPSEPVAIEVVAAPPAPQAEPVAEPLPEPTAAPPLPVERTVPEPLAPTPAVTEPAPPQTVQEPENAKQPDKVQEPEQTQQPEAAPEPEKIQEPAKLDEPEKVEALDKVPAPLQMTDMAPQPEPTVEASPLPEFAPPSFNDPPPPPVVQPAEPKPAQPPHRHAVSQRTVVTAVPPPSTHQPDAPAAVAAPAIPQAAPEGVHGAVHAQETLTGRIRDAVQAAARCPAAARMMGQSGRAGVVFDYRDGAIISDARLARSTGTPTLDAAALSAVRAAHYPNPPPEASNQVLHLLVWVDEACAG